jgi:hypothetical protein
MRQAVVSLMTDRSLDKCFLPSVVMPSATGAVYRSIKAPLRRVLQGQLCEGRSRVEIRVGPEANARLRLCLRCVCQSNSMAGLGQRGVA